LEEKMKKKIFTILSVALVCAMLFAGCASETAPAETAVPAASESASQSVAASESATPEEQTVTDMLGREVTVGATDTIVSLVPSATEILFALGVGDRVVGVDASSNYPEEALDIEVVGDYNGPDVEKVVALEPDIIFCGNTLQTDQITDLENLGLTVVATEAVAFEDIPKSIEMMGGILGKQDEAAAVVNTINAAIGEAEANAPAEAPTVYYAMSYGDMGNWTSGPGSFINTMIEIAGGVPVTQDAEAAWLEYPIEQLVSDDPDIILISSDMGSSADDIAQVAGYSDLTAVKDGQVYVMQADILSRPGPRIADAILAISKALNQ
jgi:iron complex transport system substrate-binding protein